MKPNYLSIYSLNASPGTYLYYLLHGCDTLLTMRCDTGSTESKVRHPWSLLPQRSQHSAALANSRLPALKDCASPLEMYQK